MEFFDMTFKIAFVILFSIVIAILFGMLVLSIVALINTIKNILEEKKMIKLKVNKNKMNLEIEGNKAIVLSEICVTLEKLLEIGISEEDLKLCYKLVKGNMK